MSIKCPYCSEDFAHNDALFKHFKRAGQCGAQIKEAAQTRRHFYDDESSNVRAVVDELGTNKILETL